MQLAMITRYKIRIQKLLPELGAQTKLDNEQIKLPACS